jgi:hypothetical protein
MRHSAGRKLITPLPKPFNPRAKTQHPGAAKLLETLIKRIYLEESQWPLPMPVQEEPIITPRPRGSKRKLTTDEKRWLQVNAPSVEASVTRT